MGCCSRIQSKVVTSYIEPKKEPKREDDPKAKKKPTLVEKTTQTDEKPMSDVRKTKQEEDRPPGTYF